MSHWWSKPFGFSENVSCSECGTDIGSYYSETNYDSLSNAYDMLEREYNELENRYNELTNDYNELTNDYNELENKQGNLEHEYDHLKWEYDNYEFHHKEALTNSENLNKELKDELHNSYKVSDKIEGILYDTNDKLSDIKEDILTLKQVIKIHEDATGESLHVEELISSILNKCK